MEFFGAYREPDKITEKARIELNDFNKLYKNYTILYQDTDSMFIKKKGHPMVLKLLVIGCTLFIIKHFLGFETAELLAFAMIIVIELDK